MRATSLRQPRRVRPFVEAPPSIAAEWRRAAIRVFRRSSGGSTSTSCYPAPLACGTCSCCGRLRGSSWSAGRP
eukprot:1956797-Lingulodinium_polyedra.AAC.1